MNDFRYSYPVKVYFGTDAAKKAISQELGKYGKHVMLAYGGGSVKKSGVYDTVRGMLEDAGKDPIKRAELIGNLVQSISVIPEAIVRDVYIKECAQLLHVEDKLLVSEVAKRRETQAEKRAEQT